jgi:hypothetical protein
MALTPAQITTLRPIVAAEPSLAQAILTGNDAAIAAWLNGASNPAFIVWRTNVQAQETGNAWVGTDIDGMAALNMQRLQLLLASSPQGVFDMSRADRRAGFENPFGTNVSNASRVAMRAVWKRTATRAEKALATGTGSDAAPGTLTFEGTIEVSEAGLLR